METKEVKRERFMRLAEQRVNKVLNGFRLLANLKGANYSSTPEQRKELIHALYTGLGNLEATFAGEKVEKEAFRFQSGLMNGHDEETQEDATN